MSGVELDATIFVKLQSATCVQGDISCIKMVF